MHNSPPGNTVSGENLPPLDEEETCTLLLDSDDITAQASSFNSAWKELMAKGARYSLQSNSEDAFKMYEAARGLCESTSDVPEATHHWQLVQSRLGFTNRRFGRYELARVYLEAAVKDMGTCKHHVQAIGELGVVYRYLNRLDEAKNMFESQYKKAKDLKLARETCRAVGNLGITNYELSPQLLDTAIDQLRERVEVAQRLRKNLGSRPGREEHILKSLECIGLGRLSLCYATKGNLDLALDAGKKAVEVAQDVVDQGAERARDSTAVAYTRYFYGRALLLAGRLDEAMEQFDRNNECTPAISLCKEPSYLHRRFLRQLVDTRVNMSLVDEHNYTALDYAVFNNDEQSEEIVLEGLRQIYEEGRVRQLLEESRLRKSYRELFQEMLRPVLNLGRGGSDCFKKLRRVYAEALAEDERKRKEFDGFKYMRYLDFLKCGSLQRFGKNLAKLHVTRDNDEAEDDFVVFFSYRWLDSTHQLPDNTDHTQYHRMVVAIKQLLEKQQERDETRVGIWVDYSCINQEDSDSGVHALPMILAQCNAVISLIDNEFSTRAWCSLESLLIQTLKESYGIHLWYEQTAWGSEENWKSEEPSNGNWRLDAVLPTQDINLSQKQLSNEEDWPKVLFLERQAKLLG